MVPSASRPLALYCDKTGVISLAKEPTSHKNTKHIKHHFHNLRENVRDGDIEICKVHTDLVEGFSRQMPSCDLDAWSKAT